MIAGLGTDLVDMRRIARVAARHPARFAARVLTAAELRRLEELRGRARLVFLAGRWAAKEALAKALGCGMRAPVFWRRIGVGYDAGGRPCFEFSPEVAALTAGGRCHLSLSHDGDYAVAFAAVEKEV